MKVGVIGYGHMGKLHAQKYKEMDDVEFVGYVDKQHDLSSLLRKVDAVSVAVPATLHYEIGKKVLESGTHMLIEKPGGTNLKELGELANMSYRKNLILQVGYIERYTFIDSFIPCFFNNLKCIKCYRLGKFIGRGTDVDVILDLMVHDINMIQTLILSDINSIIANGDKKVTEELDIADASIYFENGVIVQFYAGRIFNDNIRRYYFIQKDFNFEVDYKNKSISKDKEKYDFINGDPLMTELFSFISCIEYNSTPRVSVEDAMKTLKTALWIKKEIK